MRGGHSSGVRVAARFKQPTRTVWSRNRLGSNPAPSLFGFAPGGVYHAVPVAGSAVRSYRTLSPLPLGPEGPRRFAFCGTFPGVAPAGR